MARLRFILAGTLVAGGLAGAVLGQAGGGAAGQPTAMADGAWFETELTDAGPSFATLVPPLDLADTLPPAAITDLPAGELDPSTMLAGGGLRTEGYLSIRLE